MLSGEIEIDESLLGRKMKYRRGNPRPGLHIWLFAMMERQSDTVIVHPVDELTRTFFNEHVPSAILKNVQIILILSDLYFTCTFH